jgi:quercetin dioxygenase-like cupin family protein
MKINRWTAELNPDLGIIENLFSTEGLEYKEVVVPSGAKISNQRTTMTEVIQLVNGELIFNLSGTQFALRAGDRLEVAANTMYSYNNLKNEESLFLTAYKL